MTPLRRELLNGVFVLVLASLMSAAFAAFQVGLNLQLWVLILIGVGVAVGFYVMFDLTLRNVASTEAREMASEESTRQREERWLKRVGTPVRFELHAGAEGLGAGRAVIEALKVMRPGSDVTFLIWVSAEGGKETVLTEEVRERVFSSIGELVKSGTIREYKQILCFDHYVLANDHELRSGILRVGEGPGTIGRVLGNQCRLAMETKGCSVYIAPVVLRAFVEIYGVDKVSLSVETTDPRTGGRAIAGSLFFSDPPNGEIIEQFRQMERETERRMVAVHKIRFPEDIEQSSMTSSR